MVRRGDKLGGVLLGESEPLRLPGRGLRELGDRDHPPRNLMGRHPPRQEAAHRGEIDAGTRDRHDGDTDLLAQ